MGDAPLTLEEAIKLLEITNLEKVTEQDLKKIKIKAVKRWHPDTIASTKPSQNTIDHYNSQFRRIDEALELIKRFIIEGVGAFTEKSSQTTSDYSPPPSEEPEDIIKRNAPNMQKSLHNIWEFIKESGYKFYKENVVVAKGQKVKDMLRQDIKDKMAYMGAFNFVMFALIYGFPCALTADFIIPPLFYGMGLISCLIAILPLSRIWLPAPLYTGVQWFVNLSSKTVYFIFVKLNLIGKSVTASLFYLFISTLANIFQYLIIYPLYELAILIIGDKKFKNITQAQNYYANAAEWYIEKLMNKNIADMSSEELFDLSHLYAELKDAKSDPQNQTKVDKTN